MNGEGGYTIDVNAFRRGLSFCVDFNPSEYGRVVHSDSRVESAARLRWASALAANSTLFNASKFRYAGCVVDELARTVTLRLGLTNYAEFQGTHSAPRPCELFGPEGLARPLGNAIIVETTDERVPFLCRATHSGEGRGVITVTGGHPEPDDAGVFSDALIGEDSNQRVSDELWNAARKEVRVFCKCRYLHFFWGVLFQCLCSKILCDLARLTGGILCMGSKHTFWLCLSHASRFCLGINDLSRF